MYEERLETSIKFRLSPRDKERIIKYCEEHELNISQFVRWACEKIFEEEAAQK